MILEVADLTTLADYFIICTADSQRQVLAIADAVDEALSRKGNIAMSIEGRENALWVLMDYSDVIIHIFKREIREFYDLERLWGDAKRVPLTRLRSLAMGKG